MLLNHNNDIIYQYNQCQQCGICKPICPKEAISLKLLDNGLHEVLIDNEKCIRCNKCVNYCPANKEDDYTSYFNYFKEKKFFFGYSADNKIRSESSSGGTCKTLIIEGLKSGYIDGVYSLRKTDSYPYAEGEFYTKDNIPDYCDIPNSVYHSVMACTNVNKIQQCDRLMIVGTACQLRALVPIAQRKCKELIKVCIFCKQQKTLDSTKFLAKIMGEHIDETFTFKAQYRGNGWPGIVHIKGAELPYSRAAQLPFGRRLWTVPGCDVCGDSYGIEAGADISLMDPWIIRKENKLGETLITIHTNKGLELLHNIPNLILEQKMFKEVEPALSLKDIWRKQQTVPFFRNKPVPAIIEKAGKAEIKQRRFLSAIVNLIPKMPILFYRILYKYPDLRNKILK